MEIYACQGLLPQRGHMECPLCIWNPLEMYFCLKNVLRDQASEVCFGKSMLLLLVLGLYKLMTRSIGSISSPFHSVSIQNNPNFMYKYCVLKTKIKYLVSRYNFHFLIGGNGSYE